MNSLAVEVIAQIEALAESGVALRDRVNHRRRHRALTKSPERFNTICSAMDVIADSCQALRAFCDDLDGDDKGKAYLTAYGVLHAIYLQQDAAFWLCRMLEVGSPKRYNSPGAWASQIPQLKDARTARNDSTGHPVRRDRNGPLASFFIVQHSLSLRGFQLMELNEAGWSGKFRHVAFVPLISQQVITLSEILRDACVELDEQDREHYRRFMGKPLIRFIENCSYPLEKLGAKDRPLVTGAVEDILRQLDGLKHAIEERQEPFVPAWEFHYRYIGRALRDLRRYARFDPTIDDELAELLASFVRYAIDDLRQSVVELDTEYSDGGDGR